MFENRIVLKGKHGTLETALPQIGDAACAKLIERGIVRGLFAFAKKTGAEVSCSFSARELNGFLCVRAHAAARIKENAAKGEYTVVFKNGLPWTPSKAERKAFMKRAAEAAERALRLGAPLYRNAPELAKRYFHKAEILPAEGGFTVNYPASLLSDSAQSFFLRTS